MPGSWCTCHRHYAKRNGFYLKSNCEHPDLKTFSILLYCYNTFTFLVHKIFLTPGAILVPKLRFFATLNLCKFLLDFVWTNEIFLRKLLQSLKIYFITTNAVYNEEIQSSVVNINWPKPDLNLHLSSVGLRIQIVNYTDKAPIKGK